APVVVPYDGAVPAPAPVVCPATGSEAATNRQKKREGRCALSLDRCLGIANPSSRRDIIGHVRCLASRATPSRTVSTANCSSMLELIIKWKRCLSGQFT